ncbi:MAG: lipoprotein [Treponema sp.]|nr:lipoprotein [Treponema sp.]
MKKWIFALTAAVLLSSCADFFTNSWGKNAARDPGTIKVTSGNVNDLLREAKGDTKTSKGILDKIAEQLKNNPNPDPALQAAAVKAAGQAGGLGTTVLDSLDKLDTKESDVFNELLTGIQDKTKGNNLTGISAAVTESLKVSANPPLFEGDFVKNVSDSDLTLLALTLVLAEAEENHNSFEDYIKTWTDTGSQKKIDGSGLDPSERVIAAAVNELGKRPSSSLGGMLDDFLK